MQPSDPHKLTYVHELRSLHLVRWGSCAGFSQRIHRTSFQLDRFITIVLFGKDASRVGLGYRHLDYGEYIPIFKLNVNFQQMHKKVTR